MTSTNIQHSKSPKTHPMKTWFKRIALALGSVVVIMIIAVAVSLYPKFSNMSSEYATANTIRKVGEYVRAHDGQWPDSALKLFGASPSPRDVHIDYSAKSSELIEDPISLREAIRPESGKFYTYPQYDDDLASLLKTLKESNERGGTPSQ